jgi:Flp pilus assembly protein TadD
MASEVQPVLADGYLMEAYALFEDGDVTGAIFSAAMASDLDPNSYSPVLALGIFYESIGADELAMEKLERALALVENRSYPKTYLV